MNRYLISSVGLAPRPDAHLGLTRSTHAGLAIASRADRVSGQLQGHYAAKSLCIRVCHRIIDPETMPPSRRRSDILRPWYLPATDRGAGRTRPRGSRGAKSRPVGLRSQWGPQPTKRVILFWLAIMRLIFNHTGSCEFIRGGARSQCSCGF